MCREHEPQYAYWVPVAGGGGGGGGVGGDYYGRRYDCRSVRAVAAGVGDGDLVHGAVVGTGGGASRWGFLVASEGVEVGVLGWYHRCTFLDLLLANYYVTVELWLT